jgi:Flp pilus assembly pilin Flp
MFGQVQFEQGEGRREVLQTFPRRVPGTLELYVETNRRIEMKQLLFKLWKGEEGQDLTEYALLLVLLSLAAIGALGTLATAINGVFTNAAGNLTT